MPWLFAVCFIGTAPSAWAQTMPSTSSQSSTGNPLKLAVSMLSSSENATVAGGVPPSEQGRINVGLGYGRANRRSGFDISLGSAVPYSTGISPDLISYAGAFTFSSRLGRRTDLAVIESLSQRPLDGTGFTGYSRGLPGAVPDTLSSASLVATRETRSDGTITLSQTVSRRTTAEISFTHTSSRSPGLTPAGSMLGAVRLERRVSPYSTLHAGYGFGSASFSTSETVAGLRHDIDFGIDFARPLPFSGRTVVEMETGSTLLSNGGTRKIRLVMRGGLLRDLGPRWSTRVEYSRPMQFVAGFQQPFLSDALALNIDGQMSRDWFLSISGGVAHGTLGFGTGAPEYDSYNTSVRLHRQIARAWRVEAEAFATRFRFMGGGSGGSSLPSRLERQGVRVGLSWSAALFRRR